MIAYSDMVTLISRFRSECFSRYPNDIDTMTRDKRDMRLGITMKDDIMGHLFAHRRENPIHDICGLTRTPRLLKLVLRNTFRSWEHLHGEVDFDDLLVYNVLRFAAPQAFDFLLEHVAEVRGLETDGIMRDREERVKALENKWTRLTASVGWDTTSAKRLIQFLFPCWQERNYNRQSASHQGVMVSSPTDYWARLIAGTLAQNEIRDQDILYGFRKWKDTPQQSFLDNKTLIELLAVDNSFVGKFEYFAAHALDGKEIRRLAAQLFADILAKYGSKASDNSAPGFIPLWRLAIRRPINEHEHLEWIQAEITNAVSVSLRFANSIYYYWSSNSEADVHRNAHKVNLRKAVIEHAKVMFAEDPQRFIRALDSQYMYSSYQFVIGFSSQEQGGPGFTPEAWDWYAALLINAVEIAPRAVIPQIVCFVIEEQRHIDGFTYTFKHEFAHTFFGKHIKRLMQALSREIPLEGFDNREVSQIQHARETATKWMRDNP